jgi:Cu+-exporting ATPase
MEKVSGPREEEIVFPVEGMSCAACQVRVRGALRGLDGVREASVNLLAHRATVRFDPSRVTPADLIAAVDRVGFDATLPLAPVAIVDRTRDESAARALEFRSLSVRAGLGAAVAALAMLGGGHGHGFGLLSHAAMPAFEATIAAASLALGMPIFTRGVRELAVRAPGMDALVTLGSAAALALSAGAWLQVAGFEGQHHVDGIPTLVAALLVGRALEARAKGETLVAQAALASLLPSSATILREGEAVTVPTRELLPGDLVRVGAGESFPGDGVVEGGAGDADEAALTGEARPVPKSIGDSVIGGTRNGLGELRVRLGAVGDATTLAAMLHAAEAAQRDRGTLENLAERAIRPFVPAMMLVALVTALVWATISGPASALLHGANVLLVACPCALGLAIPAALTVALGRASKLGVLVRHGAALERAATITHACFDKTGTLTTGAMRVVAAMPAEGVREEELREAAAIAEAGLDHPIARALQIDGVSAAAWSRRVVPGSGVLAKREGDLIAAGTGAFVREHAAGAARDAAPPDSSDDRGTVVAVARGGRDLGVLVVGDTLREGALAVVRALRARGIASVVLTGDDERYAKRVLAPLEVAVRARMTPAAKREAIEALRRESPGAQVLFVGDGINDAPALASADVSVAMASGTAIARSAGDVLVLGDDVAAVTDFLALARASVTTMKRNLAWAVVYNALALPVAAGLFEGYGVAMTPTIAGAAMAASSLGVLAQSLALRFVRLEGARERAASQTIT